MKKNCFLLIVFILIIMGCNKEDLKWNLDKVGRLPTITTGIISNFTNISASASAEITNDGGAKITARGVCWSTAPTPLISGSHTTDSVGIGSFTSYITGLNAGTTYYVRAYATNSVGTAYGNQISFTTTPPIGSLATLSTTTISSITSTSAASGGSISNDGGNAITARGLCWSTSAAPLVTGTHTTNGTGTGVFTSNITGLTANTTYYVRAYANNSVGTAYGNQVSFTTTIILATLTTSSVTSITAFAALSGGNISSDGGAAITARGVCWSTSSNPLVSGSHTTNGTGTGSFTSNITGLTSNTNYYLRAYATNNVGTAYGNQVNFTTSNASLATLTTSSVASITITSASSGGNISSDGGVPITTRGVCWSTTANPTIANSFTSDGTGIGTFTSSITGLTPATTYYVRAFATNSVGTAYGNQVSFATICNAPTVSISSATYSYAYTNQLGDFYNTNLCGIVSNQGGGPITNNTIWFNQTNPPGAGGSGNYTGVNTPFCIWPVTLNGIYYLQIEVWNSCGGSALSSVQQIVLP